MNETGLMDIKELEANAIDNTQEKIFPNIIGSYVLNKDMFKEKRSQLDTISEKELYSAVKTCYRDMHAEMRNGNEEYDNAFYNKKFLECFISTISYDHLSINEITCCNRLVYNYTVLKDDEINETIKGLLLDMVKVINRETIGVLVNMNISKELSTYIALNRWSSFDENINIKRLNLFHSAHSNIDDIDIIKAIYEMLFPNEIETLFISTMFDVYKMEPWIDDDFKKNNDNITFAVASILDESPENVIELVLFRYSTLCLHRFNYDLIKVRVPVKKLYNYPRILKVVDKIGRVHV